MKPRINQGLAWLGMLGIAWGIFAGLYNLVFPFRSGWRHASVGVMCAGIALLVAATRGGKSK